ncbi:cysteine hydrolase family protein [Krasilnikovia sp. MM14-A1004]|uniref:cysteine hydrolase family protein n=1 Tax=Krasilnikovia sp. MM14-A1004 TaxID=3373541 RepID=UPI00399C4F63
MSPEQIALIVVDLQHWIVDMGLAPISGKDVVEKSVVVRDAFRAAGSPVILVRYLREDGLDGGATAPANQIVDALDPQLAEHVVTKHGLDAFAGTDLQRLLTRLGVRGVVVTGISTAHGVAATARTAVLLGLDVVVVPDATASVTATEHAATLAELAGLGIAIVPAGDIPARLGRRAAPESDLE